MGRKAHNNYTEAAKQVLMEMGGGPMASRDLVAAAQERDLIGEGKWVYHNMLRKIRESGDFDTSQRGKVSLVAKGPAEAPVEAPAAEDEGESILEGQPSSATSGFSGVA